MNKIIYLMIAVLVLVLVCIATVVFYRPAIKIDRAEIISLEKQNLSLKQNNAILQNITETQSKMLLENMEKDSILKAEILLNRAAINAQKKQIDEKIRLIVDYSDADIQRAFAELEE